MLRPRASASPLLAVGLALIFQPGWAPAQVPVAAPTQPPVESNDATRDSAVVPASGGSTLARLDQSSRSQSLKKGRLVVTLPGVATSDSFAEHARAADAATDRKDWPTARAEILEAQALNPTSTTIDALRINLEEAMGRREHLIATYDDAIRHHPEVARFWLGRGVARCSDLDRGGLTDIDRGTELAGGPAERTIDGLVASYRFDALAALGDHAAAVAVFDEQIASTPLAVEHRLALLPALSALGQMSRVLAELDAPLPPRSEVQVARWRSYALTYAGRFAEALAVMESPANLAAAKNDYWYTLSLLGVGRTAEARATAEAMRARWPKNARVRCLWGAVALAEHDFAGAYDLFAEPAGSPNAKLFIGFTGGAKNLQHPAFDWATVHFDERCRVVPTLPWVLVARFGPEARTSLAPQREMALAWVARTRAVAGLDPSLCLCVQFDHDVQPWRHHAQAGQLVAALLLGDRAKVGAAWENIWYEVSGPYSLADEVHELRRLVRQEYGL